MKSAPFFLLIIFMFFTIFGQNEDENAQEISTDSQVLRNAAAVRDSISLESQEKRVKNHRYIVVSAITMMLFIGLCMASVSSLNPE